MKENSDALNRSCFFSACCCSGDGAPMAMYSLTYTLCVRFHRHDTREHERTTSNDKQIRAEEQQQRNFFDEK